MSAGPDACGRCLSRPLLLRSLAAHIDRSVHRRAGERAVDLLALTDEELAAAVTSGPDVAAKTLALARSATARRRLRAELRASDCWAICGHSPRWPGALARLGGSAPRALFCRGEPDRLRRLSAGPAVTIVGARRAGSYGRDVARELGRLLAAAELVVVSGMALGVDGAAHEGALEAGVTVAVLGSGPDRPYPRSLARLYRRIAESGLVASELPPATPTFRWTFPARNRLMAALAGLTVVVEAAERSGSLITAEMATELGRHVGAVPGPVTSWRSRGTNALLADGAQVIRDARDALECLLGAGAGEALAAEARDSKLQPRDRRVLAAVEAGAATPDAVSVACSLPAADAAAALALLEIEDYVRSDAAGRYRRSSLTSG